MERSSSWETDDGGLDGHAHGNWSKQGRPGRGREELAELLAAHSEIPHVAWLTAKQSAAELVKKNKTLYFSQDAIPCWRVIYYSVVYYCN